MTLLDALKRLAKIHPHYSFNESLRILSAFNPDNGMMEWEFDSDNYSTEDCDRILAEHGMCMWVVPFGYGGIKGWQGAFGDMSRDISHWDKELPTKRAATEATFLAALTYIIKAKEGK